MDYTYWSDQLTKAKALAAALFDAITALSIGGIQSYELDTGQTKQRVTKLDLTALQTQLDSVLNLVATLEARVNGSGVVTGRPAW